MGEAHPAGLRVHRGPAHLGVIMGDVELPDGLRDELRAAWHRYVDLVAPARPALHGYCRRLTGNVWDAEDLVQDTLVRTFATLGKIHHQIREPRAYLSGPRATCGSTRSAGAARRRRRWRQPIPRPIRQRRRVRYARRGAL